MHDPITFVYHTAASKSRFNQIGHECGRLTALLTPCLLMQHGCILLWCCLQIAEGEHKGVEGISVPTGTYSIDEKRPYRQNVHFKQLRLFPKDRSPEGVAQFKAALKDDNPTMARTSLSLCVVGACILLHAP